MSASCIHNVRPEVGPVSVRDWSGARPFLPQLSAQCFREQRQLPYGWASRPRPCRGGGSPGLYMGIFGAGGPPGRSGWTPSPRTASLPPYWRCIWCGGTSRRHRLRGGTSRMWSGGGMWVVWWWSGGGLGVCLGVVWGWSGGGLGVVWGGLGVVRGGRCWSGGQSLVCPGCARCGSGIGPESVRWSVRGRSGVGPVELSSLGRLPLARAWWSRRPSSSAHGRLAKTRASPPCAVAGSARISAARAREALPISRMAAMVDGSSESESHESSTSGGGPSESEEGSESSVPYLRPRPAGAMSCDRAPVWPPLLASGRGRPAG